jgi:hypothetical protein
MALTTALALGIGAAASLGGAALSSSAQKSAANKAAQVSTDTTATNNALARDIYGQNQQALAPFMQRGNVAGDYINAMLGIPSTQIGTMGGQQGYPTQQPNQAMPYSEDYGYSPNQYGGQYGMGGNDYRGQITNGGFLPQRFLPQRFLPQRFGPTAQGNMTASGGISIQPQGVTTQNAQDAFGKYIKNSDYGFQFGQGSNALNSGYAGAGTLQSGAAMKAMEKFRQDLQSGYRTEYMGALGNQQGVGLSGASALAGVSQNFANTMTNNNNSAGNALANAALAKGNSGLGNGLGLVGGGLFGYATGK